MNKIPQPITKYETFEQEIRRLINCNSLESGSDTPDFILAEYLKGCLEVFDRTVKNREKWYGRGPKILDPQPLPPPDIQ